MDPATIIVAALVAGLSAGTASVAEQAIKDAYNGLKTLITGKYAKLRSSIDYLEAAPETNIRRASVAEELRNSKADEDSEIQELARVLIEKVHAHSPDPEQRKAAKFYLDGIKTAYMRIKDVDIRGANPEFSVTNVETTTGGFEAEGVKVWETDPKN